jgi:enoyl-CoA hydratase
LTRVCPAACNVSMSLVKYVVRDGVAVITLNRPAQRNAVNGALTGELEAAIDRLEGDPEVTVGILTATINEGSRPTFCAGHDLSTMGGPEDGIVTERGGFAGLVKRQRDKPLIAAVDGLATAGGCELVLACDIVVASERASFALPEAKWNLVAGGGGIFRLTRIVGKPVAMDILLTCGELPAERAYQLGLVSRLVRSGSVDDAAMGVAREIRLNGPLAVRLTRRAAAAAEFIDDKQAWEMCQEVSAEILASADVREGLSAFAEKRLPKFSGR